MDWNSFAPVITSTVVALAAIATSWWQISRSEKQFERRLEREREVDQKAWRRKVRSEPLIEYRAELARMATKFDRILMAAQAQHTRPALSDDEVHKIYEEARSEWTRYAEEGGWTKTLLTLDDPRLVDKLKTIIDDYRQSWIVHMNYQRFSADKLAEAMQVYDRNGTRIVELQGLINQKLEEL
jgi:PIN domain nuclease of toxin-antitoxin system